MFFGLYGQLSRTQRRMLIFWAMIELPADDYRALVSDIARAIAASAPAPAALGSLAPLIDSTLLRPAATAADIDQLCEDAARHGFAAVCVNPVWVARAA